MHLNRNGLSANKVWIFTDEFILCLGSNIHTDSTATLITSIDQRFKKEKYGRKETAGIFMITPDISSCKTNFVRYKQKRRKDNGMTLWECMLQKCWKVISSLFT